MTNEEKLNSQSKNINFETMRQKYEELKNELNGIDPLFPQAVKICIDNDIASTVLIQRNLLIGYPRAARMIDIMEECGFIASAEGANKREVYLTLNEFQAVFGDNYD